MCPVERTSRLSWTQCDVSSRKSSAEITATSDDVVIQNDVGTWNNMADRAGFLLKPGCCGVPIPAGAFFRPKSAFFLKTRVLRCPHSRRGFFFAQKVRFYLKTRVLRCPHSRRGFFSAQKVTFSVKTWRRSWNNLTTWLELTVFHDDVGNWSIIICPDLQAKARRMCPPIHPTIIEWMFILWLLDGMRCYVAWW